MSSELKDKKSANIYVAQKLIVFVILLQTREIRLRFWLLLAKHVSRIGLPWQQFRSLVTKNVQQMMYNRLTIKATKFQQSSANHF